MKRKILICIAMAVSLILGIACSKKSEKNPNINGIWIEAEDINDSEGGLYNNDIKLAIVHDGFVFSFHQRDSDLFFMSKSNKDIGFEGSGSFSLKNIRRNIKEEDFADDISFESELVQIDSRKYAILEGLYDSVQYEVLKATNKMEEAKKILKNTWHLIFSKKDRMVERQTADDNHKNEVDQYVDTSAVKIKLNEKAYSSLYNLLIPVVTKMAKEKKVEKKEEVNYKLEALGKDHGQ